MPKTETRNDKLQAAHDRLTAAVESIVSGEDWQRMLKVASKFHNYSFNNQLMIFMQHPDATLVAGFNKWKSMDRMVRKGEKGIVIFAPCKYKTQPSENGPAAASPDGKTEEKWSYQLRGFRIVHVFDISQTDGEPIEDLEALRPKLLEGDAPEGIWGVLVAQANDAGFEVIRHQRGSENGYCDFVSGRIGIRPDVEPLQAVKTLIHELGHALLHARDETGERARQEVEVESVAFIVLDALGLESAAYSFSYVAHWANGEVEVLRETAKRVVGCAAAIINGLQLLDSD